MLSKSDSNMRKVFNPWKRSPPPDHHEYYTPEVEYYFENLIRNKPRFMQREQNTHLDIDTKRAALSASPYVVSIVSYSGDVELNRGSGTIIESNEHNNIVLTSARLFTRLPGEDKRKRVADGDGDGMLADSLKVVVRIFDGRTFEGDLCGYDLYYNVAAIRFESNSILSSATLNPVDDSLDLNPRRCETSSLHLRHHSSSIKLVPSDIVVAVGRYFATPYEIMGAPGQFSVDYCENYGCKELLNSTSKMTQCGDGGPLVNLSGEVLGVAFYDFYFTPFLPINMACKWWEFYKRDGENLRRPSLGMEASNLYNANFIVAKIIERFPSISKGVVVDKVLRGSSAESAGLRRSDVIIECAGKVVQGCLEFLEILWDHVGKYVDLVVVREIIWNVSRCWLQRLRHMSLIVGRVWRLDIHGDYFKLYNESQ